MSDVFIRLVGHPELKRDNLLPVSGSVIRDNKRVGGALGFVTIKEFKPKGRPPDHRKRVAVVLAREVLTETGFKERSLTKELAKRFPADTRSIRRILNKAKPLLKGKKIISIIDDEHGATAAFLMDSSAVFDLKGDDKAIDGLGWCWLPWQQQASYGRFRISFQ